MICENCRYDELVLVARLARDLLFCIFFPTRNEKQEDPRMQTRLTPLPRAQRQLSRRVQGNSSSNALNGVAPSFSARVQGFLDAPDSQRVQDAVVYGMVVIASDSNPALLPRSTPSSRRMRQLSSLRAIVTSGHRYSPERLCRQDSRVRAVAIWHLQFYRRRRVQV